VYADFDDEGNVKIVGGDILRYASKCLIEIRKLAGGNRIAILRKHRSLPEDAHVAFRITRTGIEEAQVARAQGKEENPFTPANEAK
jgi:DNA repair protein RadB